MTRWLVLGATSGIAQAIVRRAASRGDSLHLVARNGERLGAVAADAGLRGASAATTDIVDLAAAEDIEQTLTRAWAALGGEPDAVLIAYGVLLNEPDAQRDAAMVLENFSVNLTSVVCWCEALVRRMTRGGRGVIAVLSSVSGDRGRAPVAMYGAAKAGLSTYLSALRQRTHRIGPRILTIKPGYVDTPMTAALPRSLLIASPDRVAVAIVRAVDRAYGVVYVPWFWRYIMLAVRVIPESAVRALRR